MLLNRVLKVFGNRNELWESAKTLTARLKVLDEGHDPHMLDVAEMLNNVWESVTEVTIAQCWIKSDTWPKGVNIDLINKRGMVSMKNKCGSESELNTRIHIFYEITCE